MIKKVANTRIKDRPNKVRAKLIIDVEGEYYDDESTVETLRYCVEQDLEDAGFNVIDSEIVDPANKALEQTRWIPVSKELPEENIHVLCQFYMGGMAECYHAHGVWHIVGGYRISCDEVVAWMPLPEPYQSND